MMTNLVSLTEDLALEIASYLPAEDLLHFQCVSLHFSCLNTAHVWRHLCQWRWKHWSRYELTPERLDKLNHHCSSATWKDHYQRVELDATRMTLKKSDLFDLCWFLSFALSGVRGETRSDIQRVHFNSDALFVPGYPPLNYNIVNETPPSSSHIRKSRMGDQPFSTKQWLQIAEYPPHFITRRLSSAEWLIANESVMLVSSVKDVS